MVSAHSCSLIVQLQALLCRERMLCSMAAGALSYIVCLRGTPPVAAAPPASTVARTDNHPRTPRLTPMD